MKLILVLLFALCVVLAGCGSQMAVNNTSTTNNSAHAANTPFSPTPVPTEKPLSLDEEGMKIGRKNFEDQFVQCGDSYYILNSGYSGNYYSQYRDVSFTLDVDPVSEVDRMNGLEWSGRTRLARDALAGCAPSTPLLPQV